MTEGIGIDLNSRLGFCHSRDREGMAYELGPDDLFAGDEFSPASGVSPLCRALPRRLQGPEFFLLGSVSVPSLRATHRARKSTRHRSLFAFATAEAVSHGFSR